jgi:hypothetical protein
MAFNPIAGKQGSTLLGTLTYAFAKWKLSYKAKLVPVNNFTSGFQQLVTGLLSATVSLSGPYDVGNMPMTIGNSYLFTLGITSMINLQVTALIESLEPEDDIEGAAMMAVTAQTSGSFTISLS